MTAHREFLRATIEEFVDETGSAWGHEILDNFRDYVGCFWLVKPRAADINEVLNTLRQAA
jgi:glutamate synthase (NADPH/NADH) large chain